MVKCLISHIYENAYISKLQEGHMIKTQEKREVVNSIFYRFFVKCWGGLIFNPLFLKELHSFC